MAKQIINDIELAISAPSVAVYEEDVEALAVSISHAMTNFKAVEVIQDSDSKAKFKLTVNEISEHVVPEQLQLLQETMKVPDTLNVTVKVNEKLSENTELIYKVISAKEEIVGELVKKCDPSAVDTKTIPILEIIEIVACYWPGENSLCVSLFCFICSKILKK